MIIGPGKVSLMMMADDDMTKEITHCCKIDSNKRGGVNTLRLLIVSRKEDVLSPRRRWTEESTLFCPVI